jgi:hypothetical protein
MNTIPSSLSKEEILIEGAALALFRRYNPKMNPESGIGKKLMKGFLRDAKIVLEYAAQQLQPPGTSDAVEEPLYTELFLGESGNTMTVNCFDDDHDLSIVIRDNGRKAIYSMNAWEVGKVIEFLTAHLKNEGTENQPE